MGGDCLGSCVGKHVGELFGGAVGGGLCAWELCSFMSCASHPVKPFWGLHTNHYLTVF